MAPIIKRRVYVPHPSIPTTSDPKSQSAIDFNALRPNPLPPPPTTLSGHPHNATREETRQRFYPPHPATTPDPGPKVVIDINALESTPLPPPPTTLSGQSNNAAQRERNSKPEVTEDDLVEQINKLEKATFFTDLADRASYKIQLAEKKASDKTVMAQLIFSAHLDLLDADIYAQKYTFGESRKKTGLSKIDEARTALETLAKKHGIPIPVPAPKKADEYPKISRIVYGIFVALALLFSVRVALHFVIRKHRAGIF